MNSRRRPSARAIRATLEMPTADLTRLLNECKQDDDKINVCLTDGCNHGNCEAAAVEETKRWAAEEREYDRREAEAVDDWRGAND